jgi:hypothetical protein
MKFQIAGPFKISRFTAKRIITRRSKQRLKALFERWHPGLVEACGCYVFAVRAAKGYKPYYAGQALRRSILNEAMSSGNVTRYNEVLGDRDRGAPVLFALPWLTNSATQFRKRAKKKGARSRTLDFLEDWLISAAYRRNRHIINVRGTRFLKGLHVVGLFNAKHGESTKDSQQLAKALRL